jgi:hypothetical protein
MATGQIHCGTGPVSDGSCGPHSGWHSRTQVVAGLTGVAGCQWRLGRWHRLAGHRQQRHCWRQRPMASGQRRAVASAGSSVLAMEREGGSAWGSWCRKVKKMGEWRGTGAHRHRIKTAAEARGQLVDAEEDCGVAAEAASGSADCSGNVVRVRCCWSEWGEAVDNTLGGGLSCGSASATMCFEEAVCCRRI